MIKTDFRTLSAGSIIGVVLVIGLVPCAGLARSQAHSSWETHPAAGPLQWIIDQGWLKPAESEVMFPDQPLHRAEALTLLVRSLLPESDLSDFSAVPWLDIPADAPYRQTAAYAYSRGILDGPEEQRTLFEANRPVQKNAFLKMLFLLYGENPTVHYDDITGPLARDCTDAGRWDYPLMRYALATSVIHADEAGNTAADTALTVGDAAIMLHRYRQYRQGTRQRALFAQMEYELERFTSSLLTLDHERAAQALNRARLSARGAATMSPLDAFTLATVHLTNGYDAFFHAYEALQQGEIQSVLAHSERTWNAVAKAQALSPEDARIIRYAADLKRGASHLAIQASAKF